MGKPAIPASAARNELQIVHPPPQKPMRIRKWRSPCGLRHPCSSMNPCGQGTARQLHRSVRPLGTSVARVTKACAHLKAVRAGASCRY